MIRISQVKIEVKKVTASKKAEQEALLHAACKALRVKKEQIHNISIVRKSIDARKKPDIKMVYTIDVAADKEEVILKKNKKSTITKSKHNEYKFLPTGEEELLHRPVIIGTGPAGLFCAYMLAEQGYRPIVLERGACVEERIQEVEQFWKTGNLDPECNVQFGEGGAGTFSDGKLNTVVRDDYGRNKKIFETFVEHGAPEEIIYQNKPHIGTDRLRDVVRSMRKKIEERGGEVRFRNKVTDILIQNGKIVEVIVNETEHIPCDVVVLAIGHSARDTFEMLYRNQFEMTQKSFAIGVRIEHSQAIINQAQYGEACTCLPAADYKLTYQSSQKRSIYSFCMCPGGFVVNSSSEKGHLVVNGMSNYDRAEKNANSAMIVAVTPEDFEDDSPLAGVYFQRKWEQLAYKEGNGKIPVQLFGDLCNNKKSTSFGTVTPNVKGEVQFGNLRNCLPGYVVDTIVEGVQFFEQKIPGYANPDAILLGVETRTSSPVRIVRNEQLESNYAGIYPCGEGAGYAGGITSAAIDGIKVYEAIARKYKAK